MSLLSVSVNKGARKNAKPGKARHAAALSSAPTGEETVVAGFHAVAAALDGGCVSYIYVDPVAEHHRLRDCLAKAAAAAIPVVSKPPPALAGLSGGSRHQGIAARVRLPSCNLEKLAENAATIVALDGVTDPRNLGAMMRIAYAFDAAAVIVPKRRSAPLSAVALRAAAAAAACLPVIRISNLARILRQLRAAGWTVAAAADDAGEMLPMTLPPPVCWVFGDESKGLRRLTRENCDYLFRIPTVPGDAGCLNVSAACAVCLAASRLSGRHGGVAEITGH